MYMRDYPTLHFNTIMNWLMKPLAIGKYLEFLTLEVGIRVQKHIINFKIVVRSQLL